MLQLKVLLPVGNELVLFCMAAMCFLHRGHKNDTKT